MLSKVSSSTVQVRKYYYNKTVNVYSEYGTQKDIDSVTPGKDTKLYCSMSFPGNVYRQFYMNKTKGNDAAKDDNNTSMIIYSGVLNYSGVLTITSNETLYIRQYGGTNGSIDASANIIIYENLNVISKTVETHKSLPRQLKAIGEKARCTLYGYHTNNTWYTGA